MQLRSQKMVVSIYLYKYQYCHYNHFVIYDSLNLLLALPTRHSTSLVPRPHLRGEGLVTFGWFLRLYWKFIICCKHSWELITSLHAKKVLCHCAEWPSISSFGTTNCVWLAVRNFPPKALNVNDSEAWGFGQMPPDLLLAGGVYRHETKYKTNNNVGSYGSALSNQ